MRYPALSFPGPVLTRRDIEDKLYRCRGLIPIDIDLTLDQLIWADLGQYHCYRGFFHQAFAEWAFIRGAVARLCWLRSWRGHAATWFSLRLRHTIGSGDAAALRCRSTEIWFALW